MAPHWLGEHQRLMCQDCQIPIRFQLDESDAQTKKIVCPNCGYPDNSMVDATVQPAQRATIHKEPTLSRWDVVAARLPDTNAFGIKRVVGLPMETIEIVQGDLYANGQRLIKPWVIQKETRILVYDSKFQPTLSSIEDRWTSDTAGSGWLHSDGHWQYGGSSRAKSQPVQGFNEANWNWLKYRHWRCCAHQGNRQDVFPLEDVDSFNPSRTRSLNSMTDACFEIHFRASSETEWGWRYYRGGELLEFRLNVAERKLSLFQRILAQSIAGSVVEESRPLIEVHLPEKLIDPAHLSLIEVSTIDGQLLVFVNGHRAISQMLSDEVYPAAESSPFNILEIGGSRGELEIGQVKIWRDIFYLPVQTKGFSIPADSFFLLGDNVPVSLDSRHWEPCGILRKNILGIVKPATNR